VRTLEHRADDPLGLAHNAEQHVLALDRDAAQLAGFVPREEQDAAGVFAVTLEHGSTPSG
jgi:hypothetical protein